MTRGNLAGKLAVILHADIAGSTELVQLDKQLAHERIQNSFQRFSSAIEKYSGRVLELRGDAILAEFERAADAVSATLSFQAQQSNFLNDITDELRPFVRVGIAMGEVVIADSTVTGSGVVQAQRVEQLATHGGVCIAASVYDSLSKTLPIDFINLGEQTLKGFEHPVRVYSVELKVGEVLPPPTGKTRTTQSSQTKKLVIVIVVLVIAVASAFTYWHSSRLPDVEAASIERMAYPLPDKPSIAVLPFNNMSNDTEQDYFADGMTEDLITDISKINGIFVIARNSVFIYKDKAVKVRQVAEDLGVRYVMEGSVRRVGNQVRINAQLIDATTGGHIWAERYDGSLDDVFSMQDKITNKIVTALAITLIGNEQSERLQAETNSADAYDSYLRGWEHFIRNTPEDFAKSISFFESALESDPEYFRARTALAAVYWNGYERRWINIPGVPFSKINVLARSNLREAKKSPTALTHQIASEMAAYSHRKAKIAVAEAELAISLDTNDPAGHLAMANALLKDKRPGEAIASMREAMRLDPHYPASFLTRLGRAQFDLGNYQKAAETFERATERNPRDDRAFMYLVASYGHLGRVQEAKLVNVKADVLRVSSGWDGLTQEEVGSFRWVGDKARLREGLKKASVKSGYEWFPLVSSDGDSYEVKGVTKIEAEQAYQLYEQGVPFVDTSNDYFNSRIPGAHGLNWSRGDGGRDGSRQREFNKARLLRFASVNQPIVIYSSGSVKFAADASAYALTNGFTKVYQFELGLDKWKAAGYPIETGKK